MVSTIMMVPTIVRDGNARAALADQHGIALDPPLQQPVARRHEADVDLVGTGPPLPESPYRTGDSWPLTSILDDVVFHAFGSLK
ncbi:hypothetical protein AOG23_23965 [Rhizobium acidisoli]|nr:hypothetical protein AOG23_23965 [Rhizobium acidisoli]